MPSGAVGMLAHGLAPFVRECSVPGPPRVKTSGPQRLAAAVGQWAGPAVNEFPSAPSRRPWCGPFGPPLGGRP